MAAETDPLDFLESEELLRFFHYNKTEMSCMENPQIFLRQLRDHDLISEDRYKMVSPLKHKEIIKRAILALLDQIEKEQSQRIHVFWRCVFKKIIMDQYPTLQQLHKDLTDGSFHVNTQWPERVEKQETVRIKRECGSGTMSVDGEEQPGPSSQLIPVQRKFWSFHVNTQLPERVEKQETVRKTREWGGGTMRFDGEKQPGPSSWLNPVKKKSSPLNNGVKAGFRSNTNRSQLSVTCGDLKGTLDKDKQVKGFHFNTQLPERVEKQETFRKTREWRSGTMSVDGKEEQPGPSSQLNPVQKKFSSPLNHGVKAGVRPDTNRSQLPVTCGDLKGTLDKDKQAKGSFNFNTQLPERVEKQETFRKTSECGSWTMSVDGEEEQPGPSSQLIPVKRKFSSPLNHGVKAGVRPDTNRSQLPVTCRDLKGTLDKDKQAKGSFHVNTQLPERVEKQETVRKTREWRGGTMRVDGEKQPGPSSWLNPVKKKCKIRPFSSPSNNGVKAGVRPDTNRSQLPVTCGDLKGTLDKDKQDKGSFHVNTQWPERVEKQETIRNKREWGGGTMRFDGEKQPGPSSWLNPVQRKCKIRPFSSPLNNGVKAGVRSNTNRSQLSVTCGDLKGTLDKDKQAKGFHFNTQLPERVEKQETFRKTREWRSWTMSVDGKEEPGPSSQLNPVQKKFSSPLNHGVKAGVRPDTNRSQLPVTCGDLKGTLDKDKQAKGEKCILFNNRWFVPPEFEKRAGKKSKKWKMSIRSNGIPLGKLIEAGELRLQSYRRGCKRKSRAKKSQVQVPGCGPYTKRIQEKTVTIWHHGNQKK